ncbi:MAG: YraN family protein, partial [Limisphaerales bacterium]
WEKLKEIFQGDQQPEHLRRGALGERSAKKHLKKQGLKFLTANFADKNGEIDLIFRDSETLIFVEVKTRTYETFSRPADAVDRDKQRRLFKTANAYLRKINYPEIYHRYDIVEVILTDGKVTEVRHLPNAFQPD